MFTSFARRLTAWYVVAAVVLVSGLLSVCAAAAMMLYVRIIDDGVEGGARSASAFAMRAQQRHQSFRDAALEFQRRDRRTAVRSVAFEPPAIAPAHGHRVVTSSGLLRAPLNGAAPAGARPRTAYVNGDAVVVTDARSVRFAGSRMGYVVGSLFNAHFKRVPFLDGEMTFTPDADAIGSLALALLSAVLLVGVLAGIVAWFAGRYITSQALRPLVDVTHALQRFAGREFSAAPIPVTGRSEFDAIALAYNAAAAQVASAFDERRQAESQMRQFVADAGHELRTPLTIVLGYIDLLKRKADDGDERSRRIFASIGSEGARMRQLIDNLVLLARLEGGDPRPAEPFLLVPLLMEIVDARRLVFPGADVAVDAAVDATVIGNREELHEAIANVVDNALKYAPGAPVRLTVRGVDASQIEVCVRDEGPGIDPADRAHVFERFYRGASRGEIDGSGLGLAIARRAVERAGGSLTLARDRGATFVFRLRAVDVLPAAAPLAAG